MNWINALANVGLGVASAVAQKQMNEQAVSAPKKPQKKGGCLPCEANAYAAQAFSLNYKQRTSRR